MNMRNIQKETNDLDYQGGSFHWQNINIDKIESCYTHSLGVQFVGGVEDLKQAWQKMTSTENVVIILLSLILIIQLESVHVGYVH